MLKMSKIGKEYTFGATVFQRVEPVELKSLTKKVLR